jgi:hypothetical protein
VVATDIARSDRWDDYTDCISSFRRQTGEQRIRGKSKISRNIVALVSTRIKKGRERSRVVARPGRSEVSRDADIENPAHFCPRQTGSFLGDLFGARGFGGWRALIVSPLQLKEVIQVAHTNVGSIAPQGALVGSGVHR